MIGKLNHVAIAVPDLEKAAKTYRETLGAKVSEPHPVPAHGVTVVFVELPNTKVELLHPLGDNSPIAKFLEKNPDGGMHHLCFEVADILAARDKLKAAGRPGARRRRRRRSARTATRCCSCIPKDFFGTLVEIEQVSRLTSKPVGAGGMSRLGADALLLTTSIVWGVTFVVQKDIGALPPLAFVAARFVVSALVVAPLAILEGRRAGLPLAPRAWRLAAAIGVMLFLGASLQQAGLTTTSATNGGFLTACYVVLTPFVVWALSRTRPRAIVLAASAVSFVGAGLLAAGGGSATPPTAGDGLVLIADLAWATGIALTPIYLLKTERPLTLAFSQYAICAALGAIGSAAFETAKPADFVAAAPAILFAGLVSGAVGYTLADRRAALYAASRGGADPVDGKRIRRARRRDRSRRAADRRGRRRLLTHPVRRGRSGNRADVRAPRSCPRLNATIGWDGAAIIAAAAPLPQLPGSVRVASRRRPIGGRGHGFPDCAGGALLSDVRRLSRLQRHPVRADRGDGRCLAHRSARGARRLHRSLHGEDGRLRPALLSGLPARRRVRQGDRALRLRQVDRRDDHPRRRQGAGDAGDRAGVRGADLRRRVAVRRGVRRLSVRGRAVPRRRHPEAPDPRHDRARRLLLHHGRAAVHPADPEHHPDHLFQDDHRRRADPRHRRRDLHPRLRHDLSRMAEAAGPRQRGGLRRRPHQRAGAGRHDPSAFALDRLPAADRGVRPQHRRSAASPACSPA